MTFSSEQFIMCGKARFFGDEQKRAAIKEEWNPFECMVIGRKIEPFNAEEWRKM